MADSIYTSQLGHAELGAVELGGALLPTEALIPTTKTFYALVTVGATAPSLAGASGKVTI